MSESESQPPQSQSAADLVAADLEAGLPEFELSSFEVEPGLGATDGVEVIAWEATLQQTAEFRGAPVDGGPIPLRGVTFVKRGSEGAPTFRRYIEWMDLFQRLGLIGAMRPVKVLRADE